MIRGAGSKLDAKEQKMIDGDGGRRAERNATAPEASASALSSRRKKKEGRRPVADAVFIITKAENEIGRGREIQAPLSPPSEFIHTILVAHRKWITLQV